MEKAQKEAIISVRVCVCVLLYHTAARRAVLFEPQAATALSSKKVNTSFISYRLLLPAPPLLLLSSSETRQSFQS